MRTTRENRGEGFIWNSTDRNSVGKPTGGQNLRTKGAIRWDRAGVSPVIATILMVAITVVLAAVLYVMVSGLVTGPGTTPQPIGYRVSKTGDGSNWAIEFIDVPAAKANSTVSIIVRNSDGSIAFSKQSLDNLLTVSSGVQYVPSTTGASIQPGDSILLATATYSPGATFQLLDDDGVLATGTLQ